MVSEQPLFYSSTSSSSSCPCVGGVKERVERSRICQTNGGESDWSVLFLFFLIDKNVVITLVTVFFLLDTTYAAMAAVIVFLYDVHVSSIGNCKLHFIGSGIKYGFLH